MFQNGVQMNRHANIRKHKRRLRKINDILNSPFIRFAPELTTGDKYWKSIYNSWSLYKKMAKKQYHRRIRNVFKDKLNHYRTDEDYDLSYSKIETY